MCYFLLCSEVVHISTLFKETSRVGRCRVLSRSPVLHRRPLLVVCFICGGVHRMCENGSILIF